MNVMEIFLTPIPELIFMVFGFATSILSWGEFNEMPELAVPLGLLWISCIFVWMEEYFEDVVDWRDKNLQIVSNFDEFTTTALIFSVWSWFRLSADFVVLYFIFLNYYGVKINHPKMHILITECLRKEKHSSCFILRNVFLKVSRCGCIFWISSKPVIQNKDDVKMGYKTGRRQGKPCNNFGEHLNLLCKHLLDHAKKDCVHVSDIFVSPNCELCGEERDDLERNPISIFSKLVSELLIQLVLISITEEEDDKAQKTKHEESETEDLKFYDCENNYSHSSPPIKNKTMKKQHPKNNQSKLLNKIQDSTIHNKPCAYINKKGFVRDGNCNIKSVPEPEPKTHNKSVKQEQCNGLQPENEDVKKRVFNKLLKERGGFDKLVMASIIYNSLPNYIHVWTLQDPRMGGGSLRQLIYTSQLLERLQLIADAQIKERSHLTNKSFVVLLQHMKLQMNAWRAGIAMLGLGGLEQLRGSMEEQGWALMNETWYYLLEVRHTMGTKQLQHTSTSDSEPQWIKNTINLYLNGNHQNLNKLQSLLALGPVRQCEWCGKNEKTPGSFRVCQECVTSDFPDVNVTCNSKCKAKWWSQEHMAQHLEFSLDLYSPRSSQQLSNTNQTS